MASDSSMLLVFAYGSLMAAASLRETLFDYDLERFRPLPVRLIGFRKGFSAVHANNLGFATADGNEPTWVGYLNVERSEGGSAFGVLLTITLDQFRRLQEREAGYHAIDVTGAVQPLDGESLSIGRVITFSFPLGPEVEQGALGRIGIGADYERLVARACAEIDGATGGTLFSSEWVSVCTRHAHWPRLTFSNPRTGGAYP